MAVDDLSDDGVSNDDSTRSSKNSGRMNYRGKKNPEDPPKPVSSESEGDSDDNVDHAEVHIIDRSTGINTGIQTSRLFAPYRSLGVVASGRPFYLLAHENSQSHMLCVPIGDRFQLVQTDRLQPVLVSQTVPSTTASSQKRKSTSRRQSSDSSSAKSIISHCVSDSSLSITVVAHGPSVGSSQHITLYQRTRPVSTRSTLLPYSKAKNTDWTITSMLHLGHVPVPMTGDKVGKMENVAVIAVVVAKHETEEELHSDVPVVGGDEDDDEEEEDTDFISEGHGDDDVKRADDQCRGQVVVFLASRSTLTVHRRIRLTAVPTFRPSTAVHPATYLNKIVLGGRERDGTGHLLLLNVRSTKIVHVFQCLPVGSSITALEQSPAVDTVAVGTQCGKVHLINLRVDKRLFSLSHASAVTSLSFRTDGSAMRYGIAPLAVGRADGTVTVWDLSPPEDAEVGRQILCEIQRCHVGGVSMLQYLPQEPLLVSVGTTSNALVMHIFDSPNHSGRILKQRKGHAAPPTLIRYVHGPSGVLAHDGTDAAACQILSTGGPDRTLRIFSTARSVLDKEFSQGKGLEKRAKKLGMESTADLLLPPVKDLALSDARSRDWGDLVTIHENHSFAYVWSTKRGAQTGPLLRQGSWNISAMKVPPPPSTHATSLAMSACGNFALIGTKGGIIYKYNVQSGHSRGSFPREEDKEPTTTKRRVPGDIVKTLEALAKSSEISNRASNLDVKDRQAAQESKRENQLQSQLAHASHAEFAVVGIAVDSVNRTVVSVGADKKLILWNFSTHAPHKKSPYTLPAAATKMRHIRESDLAAIALHDFSVVLFDCSALSIVRRFGAGSSCHTGPISDLAFTPDGRTLLSSSLDGTIRVYDVPTNLCVDWLRFKAPPTSLTISPTGEFLATTHVGEIGIHMWSDKSYYQTVHAYGGQIPEPLSMDEPAPMSDGHDPNESFPLQLDSLAGQTSQDKTEILGESVVVVPKRDGLVTLSGLPQTHWKTLFHLELVKERNKPIEPPKKPPTAPFFLQWRSGEPLAAEKDQSDRKEGDGGEQEWGSAWSDDDIDAKSNDFGRSAAQRDVASHEQDASESLVSVKRRKVTHHRSHLASLLREVSSLTEISKPRFHHITEYLSTLGPSAIDVALSSLCSGAHDLEEGAPLLLASCAWLSEACCNRENFEVINAYLHRFLHLHGPLLAEIREIASVRTDTEGNETKVSSDPEQLTLLVNSVESLKQAQLAASDALYGKIQHSVCLLRHLSRMV